ncbi:urease accessory protein UreD [Photobacterium minamisatsumaniensis]|uniref:urease accessory protein UreD n=1 Tax=Photobacterium minamisatsumaniensis TaxID=2910233 RepID=UPI003D0D10FB
MSHDVAPVAERPCSSLSEFDIASVRPKPTAAVLNEQAGWRAKLELGFAASTNSLNNKTILKHRKQHGPLAVQRPLYPEAGICHVYLLHPPGGVVGGDKLLISTEVQAQAHALVTTPGATKFYRSDAIYAHQKQLLTVKENGLLEWLPQENIYFPNANVRMDTEINVEEGGRFIGWELHCFGRPALKEGFTMGSVVGCTRLKVGNELILAEQLNVQGGDLHQKSAGLRDYPMTGTMFVTGSTDDLCNLVQELLNKNNTYLKGSDGVVGVTEITSLSEKHRVLVIRALGHHSEPMMTLFSQVWQEVRVHWFGHSPNAPRIWAT